MIRRALPLAVAFSLFVSLAIAGAAEARAAWQTDYKAALAQAQADDRPVLVDFTGSDWCGWCIKLVKDTFSTPEFAQFAKEKLVLLEVDFPQDKVQSAELKKQNEGLQEKYGVEGFPTLVLLDKSGKEIARHVGYLAGGPAAMEAWIKEAIAKR